MNLDNLGTQLLFTTVHLWVENNDGSRSTGTGFIYTVRSVKEGSIIPFLVTNYHVTKQAKRVLIEFIEAKDNKPNSKEKLRVEIEGAQFQNLTDPQNDLAVLPIAPILHQFQNAGKQLFYRTIEPNMVPESKVINELGAIEDVTFIGYPSGIYDHKNSSPLIRKGITSSPIWNDFKGERCFLIDAGVFPGSSGSPVFIYNQGSYSSNNDVIIGTRLLFIGIISETMVRADGERSDVFLGLGKVIKSSVLKEFIEKIVADFDT
ncbi:TPA: trypsin-like peptidase domain-containing protein [Vibrio parahaemolyticus]|nr:trypsin-like peptidase domain-containing protein [Vibrio parahaemolyticus]HCG5966998.1 trypsin-like peptidase domain-containing protein [Vibrio parahaemolyticus]HCG7048749.1 trypsin-like peptidase domain-containing protein [Vibrio parahaemolyticus]HCG7053315.1 trypsin-like peptidase domain-containing protein [Vibrio parahaemolyticus]HCG7778762.1 trypsin-like peptidase domain-containing protein [Vibrio parahaemolyticus]